MVTAPNRASITRLLTELADERSRIAEALLAMDGSDGGLAYLRVTSLDGVTREFWERLRLRIDVLWASFAAFGEALDTARPPGDRWSRTQLTSLSARLLGPLTGPDVPDAVRGVPVARVGEWLEQECREVRAALADVGERLATVDTLRRLDAALDDASRAAGTGEASVAAALRDLAGRAAADPLGIDLHATAAASLIATTEATVERLRALATRRAGYGARRAALAGALTRLESDEHGVRDANARALARIHDPRLPPDGVASAGLRRRLDTLERLDAAALDQALPALEEAVGAALNAVAQRREFADGLLARREELRGRLDSYRAKAVRTGVGEHPAVLAAYEAARALLWTAPCDLAASTRAVVAYQRSLAGPGGGAA
ncbi:hypothetical protein [Cryptosporangium arvum]|uniref:hypothetical protein n=1 Tax=Cryptosporangium arvum TaxID=80871 RepID=UPI0004BB0F8A|nr:hypothetical protein [Cryptosporangium arvum]